MLIFAAVSGFIFVALGAFGAHARNLGITRAKHDALGAATGEILVLMDCDVRPDPDWLRRCLPLLARPDIGLVCGPVVHDAGTDIVSRYVRPLATTTT